MSLKGSIDFSIINSLLFCASCRAQSTWQRSRRTLYFACTIAKALRETQGPLTVLGMTVIFFGQEQEEQSACEWAQSHLSTDQPLRWRATALLPGCTSRNPESAAASPPCV